jgi:Helicase conserved C-terminal domain
VFGKIKYLPVVQDSEINSDIAIAKAAQRTFSEDKAAGLLHSLMIRTDSRRRADELKEIYTAHTNLRLAIIHSGNNSSIARIKKSLENLRNGELDGIICVDMLGEGFDFPQLKIAAIHAPHKSLAVTLQFIGRFARTSGSNIGTAKFLAVPSEIEIEREKLYDEDAAWQQIIINLSETRIDKEVKSSRELNSFRKKDEGFFDYRDISLHALRPYFHVKIYRVDIDVQFNIETPVTLSLPMEVVHSEVSQSISSVVFLTREVQLPRWTHVESLARIEHDLFIVHYDSDTRLLLISASRKSNALYEQIAKLFTMGKHSLLPQSKVNSVLATLSDFEFSNIGMRRRALHPNAETYRISAGPSTQNAVNPTDGRMYTRGHVYCSAEDNEGRRVNLGYSSASKVWSNRADRIPGLVDWMQTLVHRIDNYTSFSTGSPIDRLTIGEEIEVLPDEVIAACWNIDTYTHSRCLINLLDFENAVQLMDVDLSVDYAASKNGVVRLNLSIKSEDIVIDHSISSGRLIFRGISGNPENISVMVNHENVPLLDYLRDNPPLLFLQDFSVISHGQLSKQDEEFAPFDPDQIEVTDWGSAGVDISREFITPEMREHCSTIGLSIHDYLMTHLSTQSSQIVFYDHRSGEMADFIALHLSDETLKVQLYHCKGAHGSTAGSRTDDTYEVAGQVVKSLIWLKTLSHLRNRICKREDTGSRYIKGDRAELDRIVRDARHFQLKIEMILVQPGISRSLLKSNVATVLAAANCFIVDNNCEKLRVFGSA